MYTLDLKSFQYFYFLTGLAAIPDVFLYRIDINPTNYPNILNIFL